MTALESFPRARLGHWPTPLEPCERLQAELGGPLVWLKRDDCSGLATGGNKTRKLEFLLGDAQQVGADGVVTFGARQSNHARQTAAACARLGLDCDLILTDAVDRADPHYRQSGNLMLDEVLGAHLHLVADDHEALERAGELMARSGRYLIEPGGSNPIGTLGMVAMVDELAGQLQAADVAPAVVACAASTGGTAAGLLLGSRRAGLDFVVDASAVYRPAPATRDVIEALLAPTADLLAIDAAAASLSSRLRVSDDHFGPGYGVPTPASRRAIEVLARTEGVLLDPVYTAKAFAHVLDLVRATVGDGADGDIVFVHTGGQAGLFAYAGDVISP